MHAKSKTARLVVTSVTASLSAIGFTQALGTNPAVAGTGLYYQVIDADKDPYSGIYGRNGTDMSKVTRDSAHYILYGTRAELICGTWGSSVGPNNNRRWHLIRVADGPTKNLQTWMPDRYMATPNKANQATPGEPECGSTPAPPPPPVVSTAGDRAVAWAAARIGNTGYNQRCTAFVREAWANAGIDLRTRVTIAWNSDTYPIDFWKKFKTGTWGTGAPPRAGALLFYSGAKGRKDSHISLYTGSRVISTDDYLGKKVHYENYGAHARYLGWWLPA